MLPMWKRNYFGDIRSPRADERYLVGPEVVTPGSWLKTFLRLHGLTQGEFAELLGYSDRHVSFVLTNQSRMTTEFAVRLYRVMGTPDPLFLLRMQMEYDLHKFLEGNADSNGSETLQP